mmetsp:Transcript_2622/g.4823  ORF Transcript_2622/g.4823 Transcript_2622/m.4823 type:complete len:91 (+) Transcript_2622:1011-1283(+)
MDDLVDEVMADPRPLGAGNCPQAAEAFDAIVALAEKGDDHPAHIRTAAHRPRSSLGIAAALQSVAGALTEHCTTEEATQKHDTFSRWLEP